MAAGTSRLVKEHINQNTSEDALQSPGLGEDPSTRKIVQYAIQCNYNVIQCNKIYFIKHHYTYK